jgi:hypothetical protein
MLRDPANRPVEARSVIGANSRSMIPGLTAEPPARRTEAQDVQHKGQQREERPKAPGPPGQPEQRSPSLCRSSIHAGSLMPLNESREDQECADAIRVVPYDLRNGG